MGFTVTLEGATTDVEFEAYPRLLRQNGMDLAWMQRVPEPKAGRHWLRVWNAEADARAFADELKTEYETTPGGGRGRKGNPNDTWSVSVPSGDHRLHDQVLPGFDQNR